MTSRKSSILKPLRVREPLQDLSQLIPNNDDEETTTSEIQKRRVSFACINKVKEFEAGAECTTLQHTPAYDERFSMSSDSYQSSLCEQSHNKSIHHSVLETSSKYNYSIDRSKIMSNENINIEEVGMVDDQNSAVFTPRFKSPRKSNIFMRSSLPQSFDQTKQFSDMDIEEDEMEISRMTIYSEKNYGDSSMEITSAVTHQAYELANETGGPLNLTKNYTSTQRSFQSQYTDEKSLLDSSSMETTEVLPCAMTETILSHADMETCSQEMDTNMEECTSQETPNSGFTSEGVKTMTIDESLILPMERGIQQEIEMSLIKDQYVINCDDFMNTPMKVLCSRKSSIPVRMMGKDLSSNVSVPLNDEYGHEILQNSTIKRKLENFGSDVSPLKLISKINDHSKTIELKSMPNLNIYQEASFSVELTQPKLMSDCDIEEKSGTQLEISNEKPKLKSATEVSQKQAEIFEQFEQKTSSYVEHPFEILKLKSMPDIEMSFEEEKISKPGKILEVSTLNDEKTKYATEDVSINVTQHNVTEKKSTPVAEILQRDQRLVNEIEQKNISFEEKKIENQENEIMSCSIILEKQTPLLNVTSSSSTNEFEKTQFVEISLEINEQPGTLDIRDCEEPKSKSNNTSMNISKNDSLLNKTFDHVINVSKMVSEPMQTIETILKNPESQTLGPEETTASELAHVESTIESRNEISQIDSKLEEKIETSECVTENEDIESVESNQETSANLVLKDQCEIEKISAKNDDMENVEMNRETSANLILKDQSGIEKCYAKNEDIESIESNQECSENFILKDQPGIEKFPAKNDDMESEEINEETSADLILKDQSRSVEPHQESSANLILKDQSGIEIVSKFSSVVETEIVTKVTELTVEDGKDDFVNQSQLLEAKKEIDVTGESVVHNDVPQLYIDSKNALYEQKKLKIIERIKTELRRNGQQLWKRKQADSDIWIFETLYSSLELVISFKNLKNSHTVKLRYVPKEKHDVNEVLKIAVGPIIRKYRPKLNDLCRNLEDVMHFLKLTIPDIDYAKRFAENFINTKIGELVTLNNGVATFFIASYHKHLLFDVEINVRNLERLTISDINVIQKIGKVDVNLIHDTFSKVGRDFDFFSKFVKNLRRRLE